MTITSERLRVAGLMLCLVLFYVRVIAQIEVLLLHPAWLPPMEAWYSGLLPYQWLLPVQIAVLILMGLIAWDHAYGRGVFWPEHRRARVVLRWCAGLYAALMGIRLGVALSRPPHTALASGIIPVTFHWVLAGFIWLVSAAPTRATARARAARAGSTSLPGPGAWIAEHDEGLGLAADDDLLERTRVDGHERILHVSGRELLRLRRLLDA
jgi:hypothetical protein